MTHHSLCGFACICVHSSATILQVQDEIAELIKQTRLYRFSQIRKLKSEDSKPTIK
jgi:hypothetical protein